MKRFFCTTIALFLLCSGFLRAGNENPVQGSRAAGMGGASVCLDDAWSAQNNPAGLAFLKQAAAGLYCQNRFGLAELNTSAFVLALPFRSGTYGISINDFGFSQYRDGKAGLSYAMQLGHHLAAGIGLDYLRLFLGEGYGSRNSLAGEAGIRAKLGEGLSLGVFLFNPSRAKLAAAGDERFSTRIRAGLQYECSDKFLIAIETEKDNHYPALFRAGFEYRPSSALCFRAGANGSPASFHAGIGIRIPRLSIDVNTSWHPVLGYSPGLGLTIPFSNKTQE